MAVREFQGPLDLGNFSRQSPPPLPLVAHPGIITFNYGFPINTFECTNLYLVLFLFFKITRIIESKFVIVF